jgi:hypothetical protein
MLGTTRMGLMLLAVSATLRTPAQSNYQRVLDPMVGAELMQYNDAALFSDGSVAMVFRSPQDSVTPTTTVVAKISANGDVLWARSYTSDAALSGQRVVAMPDGGLAAFAPVVSIWQHKPYQLDRFNADGELIWSRRYEGASLYDYGYSSAKATPDGGFVMNLGLFWTPTFIRTNANGDPIWAKSYRTIDIDPGVKTPTFDFAVTNDGGLLITEKAIFDMMLTRTDGDGTVQWNHRYGCGNYVHAKTAIQLANADLLVAGYMDEYEHIPYAVRLDGSGTVIWARSYAGLDVSNGFQRIVELANGDILLSARRKVGADVYVRVSAEGEPLERVFADADLSSTAMELVGRYNDLLVLAGEAQLSLSAGQRAQLWRLDTELTEACGINSSEDSFTDAIDFSDSYDITDGIEVMDQEVILTTPTTTAGAASISAEDLCAILHVPEAANTMAWDVRPSLVHPGEVISVSLPAGQGSLSVLAPDGRVMNMTTYGANSTTSLPTTGWAGGCYLVCLRDAGGRLLGMSRVSVL